MAWLPFLLGVLLATQPIWQGSWPWAGDGQLHLYRLVHLARAIEQGVWFPRWLPELGYGYGFPLFQYYAPFSYYVGVIALWLGGSAEQGSSASYLLATLVLMLGMARWARFAWPTAPFAPLTASFATLFAPYVLINLHHRSALAEVWGLAWLACALSAVIPHPNNRQRVPLLALFLALLMLSHNITALLGYGFVGLYALGLAMIGRRPQILLHTIGQLVVALAITAFFWLPALWQQEAVQIHRLYEGANFDFHNHFLTMRDWFAAPEVADPRLINPPLTRPLSWGLGVVALWLGRSLTKQQRPHLVLHLSLAAIALLGTLAITTPLWAHLPLLRFVQFPWRLLGPAALFLAITVAPAKIPPIGLLVFPLFALFWLFPARWQNPPLDLSPAGSVAWEQETGWLGTTSAGDYLPTAVTALPTPNLAPAPPYLVAGQLSADLIDTAWLRERWQIDLAQPTTLTFRQFWFAGWQLTLNGQAHPLYPQAENGLLSADLPRGNHQLTLYFAPTPLIWGSTLFSVGAFSLLLLLTLFSRTSAQESGPMARVTQNPVPRLTLLMILLIGLKLGWLEGHDSWFKRDTLQKATFQPLSVNFEDRLLLIGWEQSAENEIALYWQRNLPTDATNRTQLSSSLSLLDTQGRRIAQSDSYHPGGWPVAWWQAGQYARDRHTITPSIGTMPGRYAVLVTVYDQEHPLIYGVPPAGTAYPLSEFAWAGAGSADFDQLPPLEPATVQLSGLRLWGYTPLAGQVRVGEFFSTTFYWYTEKGVAESLSAELALWQNDTLIASKRFAPGRADLPTETWPEGTLYRDEQSLLIPATSINNATSPVMSGSYRATVTLISSTGEEQAVQQLGTINLTAPTRLFTAPELAQTIPLGTLGEGLADLSHASWQSDGDRLQLALIWHVLKTTESNLTLFVHLLDEQGQIVAQQDRLPLEGNRPTTSWFTGEYLHDSYTLPRPPAGTYHLLIGFYNAQTNQRVGQPWSPPQPFLIP